MSAPLSNISVCLIVKDEADRLPQALAPFVGQVGEVLVYVDDRTRDNTVEILKKFNATVIVGPWLGFSETRRALWSMARHEWILWLDADEVFSPVTLNALAVQLEKDATTVRGFRVRRQVVFMGHTIRHGDWGRDWVLRIFPRQAYAMDQRLVHESVSVEGPLIDLPGIVEHHSFRDWRDLQARSAHYATLWARQAHATGRPLRSPFLHAAWKFFRGYILKSGWLDGLLGFKIALHNAREVFSKYTQQRDLCRKSAVERV